MNSSRPKSGPEARQAATRASWNRATALHNAHKGDQAAFLRGGGDTLFAEELGLLGPLAGQRLVHVQCNSGQDSLCLARRGAEVVGVDLADEAIRFARQLSADSGIPARFVQAEIVEWMATTPERFDIAFASYGVIGWIEALLDWTSGVARILRPGGRLVYVEFHPLVWSLGPALDLRGGDDYFSKTPFVAPVEDYVAASGASLGAVDSDDSEALEAATLAEAEAAMAIPAATSWQHTLGDLLTAIVGGGLTIERVTEYPFANGCRLSPGLVASGCGDRRWVFPEGVSPVPLMFGVVARAGG